MARGLTKWVDQGTDYLVNDSNIADEFDATASYSAGDHVYHNGTLYRFTAAHSGAWSGSDVVAVKVMGELGGDDGERMRAMLYSMSAQKDLLHDNTTMTWAFNEYIDAEGHTVSDSSMCHTTPIPVAPNKTYTLGICTKTGNTLKDASVIGCNASGTPVKLLGVVDTSLQKAGVPKWYTFNPDGCAQIVINVGQSYMCSLSAQNALGEAAVEGLFYVTTCAWEEDSISFSTGKNSSASTASPRIRTPGYADLSAEFIKTDNLEFALYGYNRDQKESFSSDLTGTFLGVWDGTKFATGAAKFFQSVNVREIYEQFKATYPNLLFRLIARIPGGPGEGEEGAITPAHGAQIKFYTRGITSLYATLGLYSRWAVCGASYDSGSTHDTETSRPYVGANQYDRSWPQILARRCGNTCTNYTKGGFTLKTFITDDTETGGRKRGLEQALRDDPQELYVITLGGNDTSRTLGTIADINDNDPDSNPETVYGLYGKIVQKLINHAKVDGYCTAKFILTTPSSAGGNWYSPAQLNIDNAIRAIGAHYGFPVVAWESDEFMRSDIFLKHMLGSHPTGILYSGMALAFERLFARAVMENPDYFNYA